jgi:hypothetical protein
MTDGLVKIDHDQTLYGLEELQKIKKKPRISRRIQSHV